MNIEEVKKALDDIRPSLQADGGDIEFVNATDEGKVDVRLTGACFGCPMSQITMKEGVEKYLKNIVPGVISVDAV